MTTTPRLALAYLVASQAQKEVTHNEALNDLDMLAQASIISRGLSAPPASPVEGDTYIVAASSTGAWAGQEGKIAAYYAGWRFKTPKAGWVVFSQSEGKVLSFSGTAWNFVAAPFMDGNVTWSPGTVASGAGITSSVITVTGAALGDFVQVSAPYDLQGIVATAYVSAANSVQVRLHNGTGAGVTLASGTWRVRVHKA